MIRWCSKDLALWFVGEFFLLRVKFYISLEAIFFAAVTFLFPIFNLDIWSMSLNNNFEGYIMISIIKQDKSECWLHAYRVSIFVQYYLQMDKYCPVTEFCLLKTWNLKKKNCRIDKNCKLYFSNSTKCKNPWMEEEKKYNRNSHFFNTTIF